MRTMAPRSDPPPRPHRAEAARRGERAALQKAVAPYLAELLAAARRELRYRTALGQLAAGDLTPAELVGETWCAPGATAGGGLRYWESKHGCSRCCFGSAMTSPRTRPG